MNRLVTFEQTILDGQFKSYSFFRLKFFNLQLFLHYLLHLILTIFIFGHFDSLHVSYLLLIIGLVFTIESFWWGGLEVMRNLVRQSLHKSRQKGIGKIIGEWLLLSFFLSGLVVFIAFYMLLHAHHILQIPQSKYYFSVLSILLSLSIQLPMRTYHSGIYAISRVARTTFSIFISDIIFIIAMLVIYPIWPLYALPSSILLRTIVGQWMAFSAIKKVYQFRNIQIELRWNAGLKVISWANMSQFLKAGLGMATIAFEHLAFPLGFFYAKNSHVEQLNIQFLILILPLFYCAVDWAKLFYFDYKKMMNDDFDLFYQKFEKAVFKIAILNGLFYWFIACLTQYFWMSSNTLELSLVLLPFFLLRSQLSILQIKQFSNAKYGLLARANLLLIASMVFLYHSNLEWATKAILFMLAISILNLYLYSLKTTKGSGVKTPMHSYAWLSALKSAVAVRPMNVQIYEIPRYLKTRPIYVLVRQLERYFLEIPHEICVFKKKVFIFTEKEAQLTIEKLITLGGGWIYSHLSFDIHTSSEIKTQIVPFFQKPIKEGVLNVQTPEEIKKMFFNYFPDGVCFSPNYELGPQAKPIHKKIMKRLLYAVKEYLNDSKNNRIMDYSISVLYFSKKIKMIFLIPTKQEQSNIDRALLPTIWQQNVLILSQDFILN